MHTFRFCALLAAMVSAAAPVFAQTLLERWRYSEEEGSIATAAEVTIPHTSWSATDIAEGHAKGVSSKDRYRLSSSAYEIRYRRAPSWYEITLPARTPGKRVFVRFEGVSSCATVFLNGERIGEHKGCGTGFIFELTKALRPSGVNALTVKADNTWRDDVGPISGDFDVPGGIYRPVRLYEKPTICLGAVRGDYGAKVVRIKASGEIAVTAHLDNAGGKANAGLSFELRDAADKIVAEKTVTINVPSGLSSVSQELAVASPHLWKGIADPYLYRLSVSVKSGDKLDSTALNVGFRDIRIDAREGFFLNGESYPLRGVNRHQDREGKSWAITAEEEREDLALIREIGANAVRCAHYPHSQTFLDACDKAGVLVWAEVPVIDMVGQHPEAFGDNMEIQLREMIAQQGHHASVFGWSLFNELGQNGRGGKDSVSVIRRLNDVAHAEDPSRPTLAATNNLSYEDLNHIPDVMAYNGYPGWYNEGKGGHEKMLGEWRAKVPGKAWGISEYGAGASLSQQDDAVSKAPSTGGRWHPEAWQTRVHEHALESILKDRAIWGTFVWNMFDFAASWRYEGERRGINDKGLVTYDRKTRKDAFFLYKANWSKDPVLHLLARRDTKRKNADTVVRYYSNLPEVKVTLNGVALGKAELYAPNAYIFKDVKLKSGANIIEASAKTPSGETLTDKVEWTTE